MIVTVRSIENWDVIDYGCSPAQSWQAFVEGRAVLGGEKKIISNGKH